MAYIPGRAPFADRKSSSSLAFEEFVPPSAWTEDSTCHYLLVDLPGFKRHELKLQVDNQTRIVVSGERQVRENKYKRFEQSFELPKNADIEKITGKLDGEILYISVPKKVEQEHQEIKHDSSIHGGEREVSHEPGLLEDEDEDDDDSDKKSDEEDDGDKKSDEEDDGDKKSDEEDDSDKKSEAYENEDESDNKYGEKVVERKNPIRDSEEDWGKEADLFLRLAIEKLRKNKGIVMTAIFAFSLGVLVTQKLQSNGQ
ncbi:inactive protein RESTRICTED TEV MOVEMENT 2-like [Cynara cardunculus var. scolymus]|uniref:inactive protein RESTRICTED TEV MOVEMENT 2-like n=1 Tax=Cynara cardunculus var. scolymus TaxID=59895 RepID=UPI000D625836|nr:inactive protein RESTRICTED TEV MOVEMENT 2-like [Cynara cardunculus var. scolymus]